MIRSWQIYTHDLICTDSLTVIDMSSRFHNKVYIWNCNHFMFNIELVLVLYHAVVDCASVTYNIPALTIFLGKSGKFKVKLECGIFNETSGKCKDNNKFGGYIVRRGQEVNG